MVYAELTVASPLGDIPLLGDIYAALLEGELRTATLIGLASIPATLAETAMFSADLLSGNVNGGSLFLACIATGYLYTDRATSREQACKRTALVGFVPVVALWLVSLGRDFRAGPFDLTIAAVVAVLLVAVGIIAILLLAVLGALLGKLLKRGVDRVRPLPYGR